MEFDENKLNKLVKIWTAFLFAAVIFLIGINAYNDLTRKEPLTIDFTRLKNKAEIRLKEAASKEGLNEIVIFNPSSLKYHRQDCRWGQRCKQCIKIQKASALKKGGIPCKVCNHL